jgi:hypothetical protein
MGKGLVSSIQDALKHVNFAGESLVDLLDRIQLEGVPNRDEGTDLQMMPGAGKLPPPPVSLLTVKIGSEGDSRVNIDEKKPFQLSLRLTVLLLFAASGQPDADGIVSPCLATDAAKTMGIQKGAVFNLIYRLRNKLRQQGLNPSLLETRRSSSGTRFRFLTKKISVIEKNNCDPKFRAIF